MCLSSKTDGGDKGVAGHVAFALGPIEGFHLFQKGELVFGVLPERSGAWVSVQVTK